MVYPIVGRFQKARMDACDKCIEGIREKYRVYEDIDDTLGKVKEFYHSSSFVCVADYEKFLRTLQRVMAHHIKQNVASREAETARLSIFGTLISTSLASLACSLSQLALFNEQELEDTSLSWPYLYRLGSPCVAIALLVIGPLSILSDDKERKREWDLFNFFATSIRPVALESKEDMRNILTT